MPKTAKKTSLDSRQTKLLYFAVILAAIGFTGMYGLRAWYKTTPEAAQNNATEHQVVDGVVESYIALIGSGSTAPAYELRTDWYRLNNSLDEFAKTAATLRGDYQKISELEPTTVCAYKTIFTPNPKGDKNDYPQITDTRFILYEAQVKMSDGSQARLKAELKHDKQNDYEIEGIRLFGGPGVRSSQVDGRFNPEEKVSQLECRPDLELRPSF